MFYDLIGTESRTFKSAESLLVDCRSALKHTVVYNLYQRSFRDICFCSILDVCSVTSMARAWSERTWNLR